MITKRQDVQDEIIVSTLEELVPKDHLVRKLDKIDFSFIYEFVEPLYSRDGRPGIDPVILFKILIIKYFFDIKSIAQTMKEIEVNVAYRWFLRMSIYDKVPHATVISKNFNIRFKDDLIVEKIFKRIFQDAISLKIIYEKEINYKELNLNVYKDKKTNKTKVTIKEERLYQSTLV